MTEWLGIQVFLMFCVAVDYGIASKHKPGKCPDAIEMSPGFCTKDRSLCMADNECEAILKCCNNGCYKECLKPRITEAEQGAVAKTTNRSENQSESTYIGLCKSKTDCPKYSKCSENTCECLFGVSERDEDGIIQKCRASVLFSEYSRTKYELTSLGMSLLIFFGYFGFGTCLLFGIKRLRGPKHDLEDLNSSPTKHDVDNIIPGLTTPLHVGNGQKARPPKIVRYEQSTSGRRS